MGEPAIVVVKRADGLVDVFSRGSGGFLLGHDLVEQGVEQFIAHGLSSIWSKETELFIGNTTVQKLLGWAESLLLIDEAERLLLWNLNCIGIDSPRLVSHMIETTSPGWRAVWSPESVTAVWRYLMSDPQLEFFHKHYSSERQAPPDDWFAPFEFQEFGPGESSLFTAKLADCRNALWLSDKSIDRLEDASPTQIEAIAQKMTGEAYKNYALWPHTYDEPDYDEWPQEGAHLDFVTKQVWIWSLAHYVWGQAEQKSWHGWKLIYVGDSWEIQEGLAAGRPVSQPLKHVIHEALGFFSDGSQQAAQDIQSLYSHPRLDSLLETLLLQKLDLPPTPFLQTDGTICWDPLSLL